jgi:hypothetical protein
MYVNDLHDLHTQSCFKHNYYQKSSFRVCEYDTSLLTANHKSLNALASVTLEFISAQVDTISDPCVSMRHLRRCLILSAVQIEKLRVMTFDLRTVTELQDGGMRVQPSCVWVFGFTALSRFLLASTQNYLQQTNVCGLAFVAFRYRFKDNCPSNCET